MNKKILSLMLCIILCLGIIPAGSLNAEAADYASELRIAGFTEEYIGPLVALHNKYPNWTFQALNTGLTLDEAVKNERTPHSQQNIQKTSSNAANGFYCNCSSCYVNGEYKITEGKSWVAASEKAVKYYLNPLNFLDEKYIFQFESTAYNSAHNQSGVEAIIKGSWMANSNIQYYDRNQKKTVWYSPSTLYSKAIMDAASGSGMSAYYLASKIMQEVGGSKPTAGGASGTYSGYEGIYNYYNIGAYTGAKDGLVWASYTPSGSDATNCNCYVRQKPTVNSTALVLLQKGTKVTYKGATQKQSDGYVWYSISVNYNGKTYNGYIRSDLVDRGGTDKYNRPWTNPYLSIVNGAKWIANNYTKTQSTGYLQKFNVNPASTNRFEHEYMANVQGAASEAAIQYNAYKKANILSAPKTFLIPVYAGASGPPIDVSDVDDSSIKIDRITDETATISWKAADKAHGYEIRLLSSPTGNWQTVGRTTSNSYTLSGLTHSHNYSIQIRGYAKSGSAYYYSENWTHSHGLRTISDTLKFTDLDNYSIYRWYVLYTSLYNSYIIGTNPPEYTFYSPKKPITRAMFVTILYRMANSPYDNGKNPYTESPFDDIKDTSVYYYNAVCWALDNGITNQIIFNPQNNVTREQTARFLFAYAENENLLGNEAYKNVKLTSYPDYNRVHSWAVEPLKWANYNDMITGTAQGYINPQGVTQRIHASKILYGFGAACKIGNFN